jgi:hypothetical protein
MAGEGWQQALVWLCSSPSGQGAAWADSCSGAIAKAAWSACGSSSGEAARMAHSSDEGQKKSAPGWIQPKQKNAIRATAQGFPAFFPNFMAEPCHSARLPSIHSFCGRGLDFMPKAWHS